MANDSSPQKSGIERRRAKRRAILDTFSFFSTLSNSIHHRTRVHDVSDLGVAFDFDADFPLGESFLPKVGDHLTIQLHLNPSLSIPLNIKVVRIDKQSTCTRFGAEFTDPSGSFYVAFKAFLAFIDSLELAINRP